ncbi:hypothetical protein EMIT0P294_40229 [Pseudomonas sp. IT-P294]
MKESRLRAVIMHQVIQFRPRSPAADFAATPKAYPPGFRHNNRHNLSESPSTIASSVGPPQIFQTDLNRNVGASLLAMAV